MNRSTIHPDLRSPEQLRSCTWLWLDDTPGDWIGWREWFQQLGYDGVEPRRRININSYSMVIQSALSGLGIALAWSHLVGQHLQTGTLVRPIDTSLRTDARFCLIEPRDQGAWRQSVKRFRAWLLDQPSLQPR